MGGVRNAEWMSPPQSTRESRGAPSGRGPGRSPSRKWILARLSLKIPCDDKFNIFDTASASDFMASQALDQCYDTEQTAHL